MTSKYVGLHRARRLQYLIGDEDFLDYLLSWVEDKDLTYCVMDYFYEHGAEYEQEDIDFVMLAK